MDEKIFYGYSANGNFVNYGIYVLLYLNILPLDEGADGMVYNYTTTHSFMLLTSFSSNDNIHMQKISSYWN